MAQNPKRLLFLLYQRLAARWLSNRRWPTPPDGSLDRKSDSFNRPDRILEIELGLDQIPFEGYAKSGGSEIVEQALQLFYGSQNPDTPAWARGVIFAALGYFICPIDAIADAVPFAGFSDDLVVLALAAATVVMYITPEVKEQARAKMTDWFG